MRFLFVYRYTTTLLVYLDEQCNYRLHRVLT